MWDVGCYFHAKWKLCVEQAEQRARHEAQSNNKMPHYSDSYKIIRCITQPNWIQRKAIGWEYWWRMWDDGGGDGNGGDGHHKFPWQLLAT